MTPPTPTTQNICECGHNQSIHNQEQGCLYAPEGSFCPCKKFKPQSQEAEGSSIRNRLKNSEEGSTPSPDTQTPPNKAPDTNVNRLNLTTDEPFKAEDKTAEIFLGGVTFSAPKTPTLSEESLSDKIVHHEMRSQIQIKCVKVKDIKATNQKILERIEELLKIAEEHKVSKPRGMKVILIGEYINSLQKIEEIIKSEMGKELI